MAQDVSSERQHRSINAGSWHGILNPGSDLREDVL